MKHQISSLNIADPQLKKIIPIVDFCYTDPPWGEGNLKYWKTISDKVDGGLEKQVTQEQLENIIVEIISEKVSYYAFIIYGKKQAESIIKKFNEKKNIKKVQLINKKYKSGSKWNENCVICVTLNDAKIIDFSFLTNKNGIKGLLEVCELFKDKYKTVLELFVGIGHYLKILNKYQFIVIGNEVNKSRLKKALNKINDNKIS